MKHLKKLVLSSAMATIAVGSAAHAGNFEETPVEAPVYEPTYTPTSGDWTGFYGGVQLGYADVDGDAGLAGDEATYGVHAGYNYDFGSYVVGAEVDYDNADIDLNDGAANSDSLVRLKFKGGYDLGSTLIYATAGAVSADTSVGDETGAFLGLGVAYKITDRYVIGAELLEHRFNDIGGTPGSDLDATTFNVRASIQF